MVWFLGGSFAANSRYDFLAARFILEYQIVSGLFLFIKFFNIVQSRFYTFVALMRQVVLRLQHRVIISTVALGLDRLGNLASLFYRVAPRLSDRRKTHLIPPSHRYHLLLLLHLLAEVRTLRTAHYPYIQVTFVVRPCRCMLELFFLLLFFSLMRRLRISDSLRGRQQHSLF
jgi:hypothetical protein